MKKTLLSLLFLLTLLINAHAQTLVSTEPQGRNAVLEEYTGIHCQYCPDGHAIAQAIQDNNPGRIVLINVHQGNYAVPSAGEPDYRTPFGDALAGQTGLTGYPSGTVNRHVFPGNSVTGMSRSAWGVAANDIMNDTAIVNVGISTDYAASTRTLTVNVELYYTSSSTSATNYINVALLQDSIYGPQTGGNMGSNYHHKHMLRHLLTGQWGEAVTTTTQGTLVNRTYFYVVPPDYNNIPCLVEDCHVAVFITQSQQEIMNGDVVYAIGGTNKYIGKLVGPTPFLAAGSVGNSTALTVNSYSALPGTEQFLFSLDHPGMPADWTSDFTINGTTYTATATVGLVNATAMPVTINVTPGSTPKIQKFILRMKSLSNPVAPEKRTEVFVIANVTDLVVNGSGGETAANEARYLNGLAYAGNTHFTSCPARLLGPGISGSAFNAINNLYLNIGWTFPALMDDEAIALMNFMDNGGNVLIAGQDIGWDIMSGATGSNGNAITQNFYTNYLLANFVDDGTSANSQLTPVLSDPIFGAIPASAIIDPYGGNMYPEEITPRTGATAIFNYNNGSKTAAVKGQTASFKVVYLGIGLEMVGDTNVSKRIMKNAHDWFYGWSAIGETQEAGISLYPNPACGMVNIQLYGNESGLSMQVLDLAGRIVYSDEIPAGIINAGIDVSGLAKGMYWLRIQDQTHSIKTVPLIKD